MKPSCFSTICTATCAHELVGLLLSLSVHHPGAKVFVMCDTATKDTIRDKLTPYPRLQLVWIVALDPYSGMNRDQMTQSGVWSDFQMSKARVILAALQSEPDTLFLDSDIIVTDVIEDIDGSKMLGVSPQYIAQEHVDRTGFYNGGMLWTRLAAVAEDWIEFTKTSRYFDQASIEDLAKKYDHFEFGENYNLQSWRLYYSDDKNLASRLSGGGGPAGGGGGGGRVWFKEKPLKFIHTHFCDPTFQAFNRLLIQHFCQVRDYKTLAIIYRVIHGKWVLRVPKQPLPGKAHHTNDSWREMPLLFKRANPDVDVRFDPATIHCWIEPNLLTYDRDTLDWCNEELEIASLLLLGNGDMEIEGKRLQGQLPQLTIQPWIYWPRRPMLVEKLLKTQGILDFASRTTESIFIGNFENRVQEHFRQGGWGWGSAVQEFHCTRGSVHKFTHEEYLMRLRGAKFGLCLRGFGSKCHRDVELMAFGTVPIVTPEVCVTSFMEPLVENTHFLRAATPGEVREKIEATSEETWLRMSGACSEWYRRNVHSDQAWSTMMSRILYGGGV
jgi:hypothetical protein